MTLTASWQSPSNIALVKYWGKKNNQEPANASLSFTLDNCHTKTTLQAQAKKSVDLSAEVWLDGQRAIDFEPKILTFLNKIKEIVPIVSQYHWHIQTQNTFPHSSGIASSASGMSAIALCLLSIAEQLGEKYHNFLQQASNLARLGSGSACRSVYGGVTEWGEHPDFKGSSNQFAIPVNNIHPDFLSYRDTILIVHAGAKSVSSSVGHGLVNQNPFATNRFVHANMQAAHLKEILTQGDTDAFTTLVESEALMLHALMMSSNPYFILMKPNTLAIIDKIWEYRKQKPNSFVFTLDAGANVHFLYSKKDEADALSFIKSDLVGLCDEGKYICDQVGNGPKQF